VTEGHLKWEGKNEGLRAVPARFRGTAAVGGWGRSLSEADDTFCQNVLF